MAETTRRYENAARCGTRIRLRREQQGLTLRDLARKAGFSHQLLGKIEIGEINTPIETLIRIADALGISSAMLLDDEVLVVTKGFIEGSRRKCQESLMMLEAVVHGYESLQYLTS